MVLSVVIPVYNGSNYINALKEILKKNIYPEAEFVIVNDGSKDNTEELLHKLCEEVENTRIITKENGGVSTARNVGIQNAAGEYIWFVDSDDSIKEGSVQKVCQIIQSGCDLYVFDANRRKGNAESLIENFEKTEAFTEKLRAAEIMMENIMTKTYTNAVWNKVFKKEIIISHNVQFPVGVINGEDTCFLLDYCDKIKSVEYIKDSFYLYVIQSGSAANNIRPETVKGFMPIHRKKIEYCEKYGLSEVEKHIRKGFVNKLFRAFFHMKRNKKVNNKALKTCINDVVQDELIRSEVKATGSSCKGLLNLYYKMHMNKNVNGIYMLVSAMGFAYGIKRHIKK